MMDGSGINRDGLLGHWPLRGSLEDATGRNPSPTYHQNPRFDVPSIPLRFVDDPERGPVLDLRGDGLKQMSFVRTGLSFADDRPKSLSVFVKTTDFEQELVWVGNGAPDVMGDFDHRCYLGTFRGKVFVGAGQTVHLPRVSYEYPVRDDAWHHYVLVVGEGTFAVWQDGVRLKVNRDGTVDGNYPGTTATDPAGDAAAAIPRSFLIGMGGGQLNHPANALLSDVAVYNRSLTEAEIGMLGETG